MAASEPTESIRFRTTYQLSGFGIDPRRGSVEFRMNPDVPVTVQLLARGRDNDNSSNSAAIVISERPVPLAVLTSMDLLARGYVEAIPQDYDESPWVRERVSRDLVIAADGQIPIRFMPSAFRELVRAIEQEHFGAALRVIGLSRWVYGIPGQPQPLRVIAHEYARAGETWTILPYEQPKPSRAYVTQSPFEEDTEVGRLQELLDSGATEPVARSLWLEASVLRYTNPRSALVSAVAAAEIGLKTALLGHGYKPKKRWPPLENLLDEELPRLALMATVPLGIPVLPPASLREDIRAAIYKRNALAHEGVFDLQNEEVDALLDVVENFVWLMDFYRGYLWTISKLDAILATQIAKTAGYEGAGDLVRAVLATGIRS